MLKTHNIHTNLQVILGSASSVPCAWLASKRSRKLLRCLMEFHFTCDCWGLLNMFIFSSLFLSDVLLRKGQLTETG